jgi:hypothetical protein
VPEEVSVKKKAKKSATPKERAVVICTDKRGVFFGYATDTGGDPIRLVRPRMCVYWDAATKGVLGLAATGPTSGCRVTLAPPAIELRGITAVIECSETAVAAWEKSPWQ